LENCLSHKNETILLECNEIKKHALIVQIIRIVGYPISIIALSIGIFLIILIKFVSTLRKEFIQFCFLLKILIKGGCNDPEILCI
jgi:hypothetical protein